MSAKNPTPSENEVRRVIEAHTQAICSRSPTQALNLYATDLVQYQLAPPLRSAGCGESIMKDLQEWLDTFDGPIGLTWDELAITATPEVAFCHGITHMLGTKMNGESVDLWFRTTMGLLKVEGDWKINHIHESVPFYMDGSGRAALDLKP